MTVATPIVLALPEPCLLVLVGAAGSGKTTFAARLFAADQVLSSDAYRARIAGDEADQEVTRAAFRLLHRDLERRLAAALTTVVDATNVTAFARRSLVRIAARHGVPAVALVLDLPPDLVLSRNAARSGRIVPEAAVRHQLGELERTQLRGLAAQEGFAAWHVLRTADELDRVRIASGGR